jgi:hypothetical protein
MSPRISAAEKVRLQHPEAVMAGTTGIAPESADDLAYHPTGLADA